MHFRNHAPSSGRSGLQIVAVSRIHIRFMVANDNDISRRWGYKGALAISSWSKTTNIFDMAPQSADISNATHERISALFLGPKAENADFLMDCFREIVRLQERGRKSYFPNDAVSRRDLL